MTQTHRAVGGTRLANSLRMSGLQRQTNVMTEEAAMNDNTDRNILRVMEFAAVLVFIGTALNIVVMQTLGSFDAAAVILGLFLGFWSFVLGAGILLVASSWLFFRRNHPVSVPMNGKLADVHARLEPVGHRRLCPIH